MIVIQRIQLSEKKEMYLTNKKTVSSHVFLKGISLLTIEGRGEFLSKLFKKIPLFLVMFDSKGAPSIAKNKENLEVHQHSTKKAGSLWMIDPYLPQELVVQWLI